MSDKKKNITPYDGRFFQIEEPFMPHPLSKWISLAVWSFLVGLGIGTIIIWAWSFCNG